MPLDSGTRIGPYEVATQIGSGGMGEVYRARDTKLDRDVALKILPEMFTDDPERLARFQREAKVLASLNHPNIAAIHGLEDSTDTHALVLELVEGPTLADRIGQGAVPLDEALPIARQIAEALEAAHEKGVIHRDLKPANIKVTPDGVVKVLDFGLAKALDDVPSAPSSDGALADAANSPTMTMSAVATRAGFILGTAGYMSPEQAKGKPVDRRTDVWAFGVVLYEMLTGRRAFDASDISETLASVLLRETDLSLLPAETPASIRRLLRRCLTKDRKNRLSDMAMARLEIDEAANPSDPADRSGRLDPPDLPATRDLPFWQRPPALAGAVAVALIVGGLLGWSALRPETPPADIVRFSIVPPSTGVLSFVGQPHDLTISPDGRYIVWDGPDETGGRPQLNVRPVGGRESSILQGSVGGFGPFVSPDSEWVGFIQATNPTVMHKVSIFGGPPVQITESPSLILGASWGADDRIVFGTAAGGLFRVPAAGGDPEPLTTVDAERGETSHTWPTVVSGHAVVLFVIGEGPVLTTGQLAVLDLGSGSVTRLGIGGLSPTYVSSGHIVYAVQDGSVRAAPFDIDSLTVTGNPVPVLERVLVKSTGAADYAVSEQGGLVYAVGSGTDAGLLVVSVDPEGRAEVVETLPPGPYISVDVAPDGQRLVLEIMTQGGSSDVWVHDLVRGTLNRLTDAGELYPKLAARWTPDGGQIIYGTSAGGIPGLYRRSADGSGDAELVVEAPGAVNMAAMSSTPDGEMLLVQLRRDVNNNDDVMLLRLGADAVLEPLLASAFDERAPDVSPDGRWIVYESDRSGHSEVYVERFPVLGARQLVSTDGGRRPRWSRDGSQIYFIGEDGLLLVAPVADRGGLQVGTPRVASEEAFVVDASALRSPFAVGPDGPVMLVRSALARATPIIDVVLHWDEELKARVPIP